MPIVASSEALFGGSRDADRCSAGASGSIVRGMVATLYIGNKNYSSWSLRPWLTLTWAGIPFEERVLPLGGDGYGKAKMPAVLAVSPSGRVPSLETGGVTIWDSLAIAEWAAENAPSAELWPSDATVRAVARSVASEMHSGFAAVRRDLAMNIRRRTTPRDWPEDTLSDIARIQALWQSVRERHGSGGPFLFGAKTIVDAFFAPVATRFRTYGVSLTPVCKAYSEAIFADPAFRACESAAAEEPWVIPSTDLL
jgi:glutathione S-transferase